MAKLLDNEIAIAIDRLSPQWLAGFFDGEGCVTVTMSGVRNPRVMVSITQQDYNILKAVWEKFCVPDTGCLYKPVRKKSRGKEMDCWLLHFTGKSCLPILRAIQPYVILKRKLVDWGIEMALLTAERGKCGRGNSLPSHVVSRRKELMDLVREENSSGRAKGLESRTLTPPVN
jgi:hypothetical protein